MAAPDVSRGKKAKLKEFARELSNDIGRKAAQLSPEERRKRHSKLLAIANRNQK